MLILLFLGTFLRLLHFGASDICGEMFAFQFLETTKYSYSIINEQFSVLAVNLNESLPIESKLYDILYEGTLVSAPYTVEDDVNTALDYINLSPTNDRYFLEGVLKESVSGLIDYGQKNRMTELDLFLYFPFDIIVCKLQISHHLEDESTQTPQFEELSYSVELGQDFPLDFPIAELQIRVNDNDASAPSNMFEISTSDCPFGPQETTAYESQRGEFVSIPFVLKSPLGPGQMNQEFCNVNAQDKGNSSLVGSTTLYYTVTSSLPNKDPELTSQVYTGVLMSTIVGSLVIIKPAINASDPDNPNDFDITYSITDTNKDGGDNYFQMESSTGAVSVKTDIDVDFLVANKEVSFKFTACDKDSQCTVGFLLINLPYVNSTAYEIVQFEKSVYSIEVMDPERKDELLQVHAQSTIDDQRTIVYSIGQSSANRSNFKIDEDSGLISVGRKIPLPDLYNLTIIAKHGLARTTTQVNIKVLSSDDQHPYFEDYFVSLNISEGDLLSNIYTIKGEGTNIFCLLSVQPIHFENAVQLERDTGSLSIVEPLSIDKENRTYGNKIYVRVKSFYDENTTCPMSGNADIQYKNEVTIELQIMDKNDYVPVFVDEGGYETPLTTFYFPTQKNLQKTLRKVSTIKTESYDFTPDVSLSSSRLQYSQSYDFDTSTRDILYIGSIVPNSEFTLIVNDGANQSDTNVRIYPLDTDYIFTLRFSNINIYKIEEKIANICKEAHINIYLLYFTAIDKSSVNNLWTIDAHVYVTNNDNVLKDVDSFKSLTSDVDEDFTINTFVDIKYFDTDPSYTAYRTATITLGTILGCTVLVGLLGLFVYIWVKKM